MSDTEDARSAARAAFIRAQGWEAADVQSLAGDASNRRYHRLRHGRLGAAMLMDAPPSSGEDVAPFAALTGLLRGWDFAAPEILGADLDDGFLLLEDMGDDLYARVLERDGGVETALYEAAIDTLVELAAHAAPPIAAGYGAATPIRRYDAPVLEAEAGLVRDWYAPTTRRAAGLETGAGEEGNGDAAQRFSAAVAEAVAPVGAQTTILTLRDYHAENLIWDGAASGRARVRLLDYQDALRGHGAYDLVSILEDARRDVPPALADAMIDRYIDRAGLRGPDAEAFRIAYATLGAQRNLKIVGIFARLALRDGKARYIDLIPRVWGLLERDLAHPALSALRDAVQAYAPPPEAAALDALRARTGAGAGAGPESPPGVIAPPRRPSPSDTAMLLAAGLGTRMRPLTETTPKPLLEAGGETLLDHAIERAAEIGAERFVVNAHHLADQIRAHAETRPETIALSDETDLLRDTGGGVAHALPLIDRDVFLVLNSDNVWLGPRALAPLDAYWDAAQMDVLLLLAPREKALAYTRDGDFDLSPEGRLIRRAEGETAPFVFTGAQVLSSRLFEETPAGAFSNNLIWDRAIAAGRAFGALHRGSWVDVGTPAGLAEADAALRREGGA